MMLATLSTLSTLSTLLLLQDDSRIDQLGHHFRTLNENAATKPISWTPLLLVGATAGLIALVFLLILRWKRQRTYHHPRRLFRELCDAHALSRKEQWLLEELATHRHVNDLAEVFIDSRLLDPERMPRSLQGQLTLVGAIREKLFGD